MGAPKGNSNNLKWTEEKAFQFVEDVYEYIKENEDCIFIGEPITELGWYTQLWSYLKDKFDFELIKRCESVLEARLVKLGVTNKSNATMTIFTLKNHYDWRDKKETDITTKGESLNAPKFLQDGYTGD